MPVTLFNPHATAPTGISEEELVRSLAAGREFIAKQASEIKARYRVELVFSRPRVFTAPCLAELTVWLSGARLHGGGDELVYLCPSRDRGQSACEAVLPPMDGATDDGNIVCGACGSRWKPESVIGNIAYNVPLRAYAEILARWFVRLEGSVDFYVKHAYGDLRAATLADAHHIDKALDVARRKRVRYIYRAGSLLRDTSAGADLVSALRSFITA